MYGVNQTLSRIGGLSVGVPGELRGESWSPSLLTIGWEQLHSRHGVLPWKDLFAPAINVARNGFPVNIDLAGAIAGADFILNSTLWSEVYAPNGTKLGLGDMCYRTKFADTLETIANEGVDVFYGNSTIASNIISTIAETGGIMTQEDLAGYTAIPKNASSITYRNKRIFSTVAPSSGAVTLSALKIFEGFDGSAQDDDPAINITTHRLVEATKFAYGQRANFGDPAFTANVSSLEASYLTEEVAAAARARIVDDKTFTTSYYNPNLYVPSRESGTSHMASADESGMAVSLTTTINLGWGSRVSEFSFQHR
jgi:gamma-glutamyltranspeptidase/glutathione hydrolase